MHKISIIVPVYKVEKYIHRCIDSILAQTFKDFELILVDDGTPDKAGETCDDYALKDDRIIVIHKQNEGLSEARNSGLNIATGDYIGFVDSDDYIENDMYRILYNNALEFSADISVCKFNAVSDDHVENYQRTNNSITFNNEEAFECLFNNKYFASHACDKLYKRELFEDIRYPRGKIYEDMFTTYKLFEKSNRVVLTDYIGYNYFQRDDSIVNREFTVKDLDYIESYNGILKTAKDKYQSSMETIRGAYVVANVVILNSAYQSGYKDSIITSEIQRNIRQNIRYLYKRPGVSLNIKVAATIISLNLRLYSLLIQLKST